VWLEEKRHLYSEKAQLLEDCVLTINDDSVLNNGILDEFDQVPSLLPDIFEGPIEWIYIVDLDREIFSVNHGAHFKLNNIPLNDVWIEALEVDVYRRTTLSTDICPAVSIAYPAMKSNMDGKALKRGIDFFIQ
jgi:hypothetical protein